MEGALAKLKIEAYTDPKFGGSPYKTFTVMYNPKAYALKCEIEYDKQQAKGVSAQAPRYVSTKPRSVTLEFLLDGTGASGQVVEVKDKIKDFFDTTYTFNGDVHSPPYLKVVWGELVLTCVLESADVSYSLFKPNGHPLRAKITASFAEFIDDSKRTAQERRSSPDLTHLHVVAAGESLPQLCHRYYRDQRFYLRVAEANQLRNFRRLEPGITLHFPPIAKLRSN
jgi:nucleoid-associated protein YgaU